MLSRITTGQFTWTLGYLRLSFDIGLVVPFPPISQLATFSLYPIKQAADILAYVIFSVGRQ